MSHLQGVFIALLIGLGTGIASFLCELVYPKITKSHHLDEIEDPPDIVSENQMNLTDE